MRGRAAATVSAPVDGAAEAAHEAAVGGRRGAAAGVLAVERGEQRDRPRGLDRAPDLFDDRIRPVALERLDEDVDLATARQAHRPAHLVADAVVEQAGRGVSGDGRLRLEHDGGLEAAAAHRAGHAAVATHEKARAHRARRRSGRADHGRDRDQRVTLAPFVQRRKQISHVMSIRLHG